jgi:putative ATPase
MKELGYGEKYQYAHDYKDHFVKENYLPENLKDTQFYRPAPNPREEEMRKRLSSLWENMKDYENKQ